jgi:hypothetical protein
MLYALPFIGSDGKSYLLDGFKDVRDHGHFDVWARPARFTQLFVMVIHAMVTSWPLAS